MSKPHNSKTYGLAASDGFTHRHGLGPHTTSNDDSVLNLV